LGLLQTPEELLLLLLQELVGPSLVVENVADVYSLVVENVDDVYPDPSVCEGALGARETLGFIRKRKLSSPIYPRTRSSDAKKEETKATEAALEGRVKSESHCEEGEREETGRAQGGNKYWHKAKEAEQGPRSASLCKLSCGSALSSSDPFYR